MDKPMTWNDEDTFWKSNFRSRPYASSAGRDYDYYQPAYRYGFDASNQFKGRNWDDVENELSQGWESYKDRGASTWAQIKDAVHDAWDRVTGRTHAHAH